MKVEHTQEQAEIVSTDVPAGESLKIVAYAGTGKTFTLREYASARPKRNFLYVAFNRSVREAADGTFPQNAEPRTAHSLAYRALAGQGDKVFSKTDVLAIHSLCNQKSIFWSAAIAETFNNFLNSASQGVTTDHAAMPDDVAPEDREEAAEILVQCADKVWRAMRGGHSRVPMTFGGQLKLFQLSKPRLTVRGRTVPDAILLDEAQDANPVMWDILRHQQEAYRVPIILVGDPYQCHPAGTLVRTSNSEEVPIEQLVDGDQVVSWSRKHQTASPGFSVRTAQRDFDGKIFKIKASARDQLRTVSATDNHKFIVRWTSKAKKTYVTYLMYRRDYGFRVGWCRLFKASGSLHFAHRCRLEKAEAAWILAAFDSKIEASVCESTVAARFGIPTATFEEVRASRHLKKESIRKIFGAVRSMSDQRGRECLSAYNRSLAHPIWPFVDMAGISKPSVAYRRLTLVQVTASNLMEGIMALPLWCSCHDTLWADILGVNVDTYRGKVYSLDVKERHTYVANGIIVLNSIYSWLGAVDAMAKVQANTCYLSRSFRFGTQTASLASTLLSHYFGMPKPIVGSEHPTEVTSNADVVPFPYTYICRGNAMLFEQALISSKCRRKIGLKGKNETFQRFLNDLLDLNEIRKTGMSKVPLFARLGSLDDIKHYAEVRSDVDLLGKVEIVESHTNLEKEIALVRSCCVDPKDAQIIFITAHRAKGLEWDNVVMADDFADLAKDDEIAVLKAGNAEPQPYVPGMVREVSQDDVNLIYVAMTRAKKLVRIHPGLVAFYKALAAGATGASRCR